MISKHKHADWIAVVVPLGALGLATGCDNPMARQAAIDKAEAQTERIAEELDQRTTETGVYVRAKEGEIQEIDPWGTRIKVTYSQGGLAETISVRSAGPDREFHTDDDIEATAVSANLKGVGEGIKEHAGETAANVAKGLVRGTVKGIKESIKEAFPKRKERSADDEPPAGEDKPEPADENK